MNNPNFIKGQWPEIGNPEHIEYYKEQCEIMGGERPICEIDWEIVKYIDNKGETNKPIHAYAKEYDCDAIMGYVFCPRCKRSHKLIITGYDPKLVYQSMLEIETELEETGFECWNCGLEFEYDSETRNVFVKQ